MASFYPLYFIAERVAGRYNDVVDLTPPGVEPHEYELTVRQVAEIDNARVGFYERGVAPSIDQAMDNDSPDHALDVTSVVPLAAPVAGSGVEHTSDDKDPHFWQDPTLMAEATGAFASTMAEADPDARGVLPASARRSRPRAARTRVPPDPADCRVDTLVVSHDAFEYLGRRYHLDIVPIAGLEPDAEPSPAAASTSSQNLIRDRGVTTVFFETLASPAWPTPWPATSASGRRCSTRSRG